MIESYPSGITGDSCAADIVKQHYRTAPVFKKHDIEFCCGGKWPLKMKFNNFCMENFRLFKSKQFNSSLFKSRTPCTLQFTGHDYKNQFHSNSKLPFKLSLIACKSLILYNYNKIPSTSSTHSINQTETSI